MKYICMLLFYYLIFFKKKLAEIINLSKIKFLRALKIL